MEEDDNKMLRIDVGGKDEHLWHQLKLKLVKAVNQFLDTEIDTKTNHTVREQAREFTSAILEHARAKLDKPSIENTKMLVEIDVLYSENERKKAETRKINAEASELEFKNSLKKLKISMMMYKAIIVGEEGKENILVAKQLDGFLKILEGIESDKSDDTKVLPPI